MSLMFPRKSYARLGTHREGIVCPHYAQYVVHNADKEAMFCPQEMWSALRPENVPCCVVQLRGKVFLFTSV